MDNEPKDLQIPGKTVGLMAGNRGMEAHSQGRFDNPTEASRKGNGPRPFMAHSGPDVESPLNRGQFSARNAQRGNK